MQIMKTLSGLAFVASRNKSSHITLWLGNLWTWTRKEISTEWLVQSNPGLTSRTISVVSDSHLYQRNLLQRDNDGEFDLFCLFCLGMCALYIQRVIDQKASGNFPQLSLELSRNSKKFACQTIRSSVCSCHCVPWRSIGLAYQSDTGRVALYTKTQS